MTSIVAVVGNPRAGSRTHALTGVVLDHLARTLEPDEVETIDLAALGRALLDPTDPRPARAREQAATADLLVLATPVYKATYTGLLKVFLDGYGSNALAGVTALGVIVSAAPGHLLATDIHLRSLLVELGAIVPTRSLGVVESQLPDTDSLAADFVSSSADVLRRLSVSDSAREEISA